MKNPLSLVLFILTSISITAPCKAADWHVSTTGSNTNAGTFAAPFQTVDRGIEAASPGDSVIIRGGTYRDLIYPQLADGAAGNPITVRPHHDGIDYEDVEIRGLREIVPGSPGVGSWVIHDAANSIYKIQLNNTWDLFVQNNSRRRNQVFVDNEIMVEARWPNIPDYEGMREDDLALGTGSYTGVSDPLNGTYSAAGLSAFADGTLAGVTIRFNPGQRWFTLEGDVTGNSAGSEEIYFTFNQVTFAVGTHIPNEGDRFYLKGSLILLDAPGEWYFDTDGDHGPAYTLYARLKDDSSPSLHTMEMRRFDRSIDLTQTQYITFEHMRFFAAYAFAAQNNHGMTFKNIDFLHCGNGWNRNGLLLQGNNNTVENCTSRMNPGPAIALDRGISGNVVENTLIADAQYMGKDGAALSVEGAARVRGNTVYNTTAHGIRVLGSGPLVERNHVYHFGSMSQDIGGINLFGGGNQQDAEWRYNIVHDGLAQRLDYPGNNGSMGIRIDNGGAMPAGYNVAIHHNLTWNLSNSGLNIWGVQDAQLEVGDTQADVDIRVYNNTADDKAKLVGNSTYKFTGVKFQNNIVTGAFSSSSAHALSEATITDNLFGSTSLTGNTTGLPLFSDVGEFDYTLAAGSPGIDLGIFIPPYTDDVIDGNPDTGAFERGNIPWLAGATLLSKALPDLDLIYEGEGIFRISGLSEGRIPPEDFHIRVNGSVLSDPGVKVFYDFNSNLHTARMVAPVGSLTGDQTVEVSLDGIAFTPLPYPVNLDSQEAQEWRLTHFGTRLNSGDSADFSDPEKDGVVNLLERAFGMDPWAVSRQGLPMLSYETHGGPDSFLTMTVTKNPEATDIEVFVEFGEDMLSWSSVENVDVVTITNTSTLLKVRSASPLSPANSRQFLRVRVQQ